MWLGMQRTTWSAITILIGWIRLNLNRVPGISTSTSSWQENVKLRKLLKIHKSCNALLMWLTLFTYMPTYSAMGLLVRPCERILEGKRKQEHPLPFLWGHKGGKNALYLSSFRWCICVRELLKSNSKRSFVFLFRSLNKWIPEKLVSILTISVYHKLQL